MNRMYVAVSCAVLAAVVGSTVVRAQCHPGVIGGTEQAGPGHATRQILRYDVDGPGPALPALVSVGQSQVNERRGVVALDASANQWHVLGEKSTFFDSAIAAIAFGEQGDADGPNLVVVGASRGYSPIGPSLEVARFDGVRWRSAVRLPPGTIRGLATLDRDGDGPQARTVVALMEEGAAGSRCLRAYALQGEEWAAVGEPLVIGNDTLYAVVPHIVSWDPDGPQGVNAETLYVAYRGVDGSGNSVPRLARWADTQWDVQPLTALTVLRMRVLDLDGEGPDPARLVVVGSVGTGIGVNNSPLMYFDGSAWTVTPPTATTSIGLGFDAVVRADGSLIVASQSGERVRLFRRVEGGWVPLLGNLNTQTGLVSLADADVIAVPGEGADDRLFISSITSTWRDAPRIGEVLMPSDPHATGFFAPTPGRGFDDLVTDVIRLPDGSLVVAGDFSGVDGRVAPRVARRDPQGRWHPLGNYTWSGRPRSLTFLDDGRILASDVGVTSWYGPVMQFDGERWTRFTLGGQAIGARSIHRSANGVLTFERLTVGGTGTQSAHCALAQWRNESFTAIECDAPWNELQIVALANGDIVRAVTPNLDRPETSTGLMRWDGVEWTAMGEGNQYATNLRVSPDGTLLGKRVSNRISRWNGSAWIEDPVEGPLFVSSITSFDVVGQDDLVVFGTFRTLNGAYTPRHTIHTNVARVSGTYWEDPFRVNLPRRVLATKALGLEDGSALVLGTIPADGNGQRYAHFGVFQLSACNACSPCIADWDGSGGVDVADVAAFFADFEQGNRCADVDDSTGVDGTDMAIFFAAYETGGC